jgi:hypothetical protein
MVQERCLADAPLTDNGGGLMCRGEQAVDDLPYLGLAAMEAGRVFDGVAEGEGDSMKPPCWLW